MIWFGAGRDRVDAVRSATFRVEEGESFGLVGESGSGKSTILRALCLAWCNGHGRGHMEAIAGEAAGAASVRRS